MKKGDIVLVPFPFTDLSGTKNRPALVMISQTVDVTLAFISSQLTWQSATDVTLKPDAQNRLKTLSLVRLSKWTTLDNALIIGRLGSVDAKTLLDIDKKMVQILQIDPSKI
jgi:mRNA interferase MazF